jgi:hypothetical protein
MSGASSTKTSYATLYEEWLLKYGHVKERLKNDENAETNAHELLSAAVAARAGFAGGLQRALMEQTGNVEGLTELWNHTMWEIDRDAAAQVGPLVSLVKASNDCKLSVDVDEESSADVDAFFDDYPECVRDNWDESDTDEDESDEEMQRSQPYSKKMAAASESSRLSESYPKHTDIDEEVERVQPAPTDRDPLYQQVPTARAGAPRNPYMQQSRDDFAANPPHPQHHPASGKSDKRGQSSNNAASWDDFRSQQNPFQTAREYAQTGADNEAQGNERQPQPSHPQHNPYNKPLEPQEPQQQQIRVPNIPESLKRKFQPPKRNEVRSEMIASIISLRVSHQPRL